MYTPGSVSQKRAYFEARFGQLESQPKTPLQQEANAAADRSPKDMEEATRISRPGFVAQKRAYFEGCFGKIASHRKAEEPHAAAHPPPKHMEASNPAALQELFPDPPRQGIYDALLEHKPEADSTSETVISCPKTPKAIISGGSAGALGSLKKAQKSGVSPSSLTVSAAISISSTGRDIREPMNRVSKKTVVDQNKSHGGAFESCGRKSSGAPTTFNPFRFRTEERAAKRKELFEKLENTRREAHKLQPQPNPKFFEKLEKARRNAQKLQLPPIPEDKLDGRLKKLRHCFGFKPKPVAVHDNQIHPQTNQMKGMGRAQSQKLGNKCHPWRSSQKEDGSLRPT